MTHFEGVTQENYDKLKIFLISNYNLSLVKSPDPDVIESFEISSSNGKIFGNFTKNDVLNLETKDDSEELEKINSKLTEILRIEKSVPNNNSDSLAHDMMIKEYAENSKKFFEHIIKCEKCRSKLAEIWTHLYE